MKRKYDSEQSKDEEEAGLYNHGVAWIRGPLIGKGGFGSVYLAELKTHISRNGYFPALMAIKSAESSASTSLRKEKEVLQNLRRCPYIIDCYGEETTATKNGHLIYNLLLEYASGGTLASLIDQSGGRGLPESDVRRFTKFLLKGIDYIHSHGYVHCDLKPENVLLVFDENSDSFVPKIGDFGLAKSYKKMRLDHNIGGTALYMAPETVIDGIQGPPSDIWALGCIVFEMLTGEQVWNPKPNMSRDEIFKKIGDRCELPKIPAHISEEGKQFLKACLVRNRMFRFTAGMLLIHPFITGGGSDDDKIGVSSLINAADEWCSLSLDWSFSISTEEEGDAFPSPSRPNHQVEIKRRRKFNNNLVDLPKPGGLLRVN